MFVKIAFGNFFREKLGGRKRTHNHPRYNDCHNNAKHSNDCQENGHNECGSGKAACRASGKLVGVGSGQFNHFYGVIVHFLEFRVPHLANLQMFLQGGSRKLRFPCKSFKRFKRFRIYLVTLGAHQGLIHSFGVLYYRGYPALKLSEHFNIVVALGRQKVLVKLRNSGINRTCGNKISGILGCRANVAVIYVSFLGCSHDFNQLLEILKRSGSQFHHILDIGFRIPVNLLVFLDKLPVPLDILFTFGKSFCRVIVMNLRIYFSNGF